MCSNAKSEAFVVRRAAFRGDTFGECTLDEKDTHQFKEEVSKRTQKGRPLFHVTFFKKLIYERRTPPFYVFSVIVFSTFCARHAKF